MYTVLPRLSAGGLLGTHLEPVQHYPSRNRRWRQNAMMEGTLRFSNNRRDGITLHIFRSVQEA